MAAVIAAALPLSQAVATAAPTTDFVAANKELRAYIDAHPDDYVGVNARLIKAGGPPLRVALAKGRGTVDAATAARIRAQERQATPAGPGVRPLNVPTDSFSVSGYIVPFTVADFASTLYVGEWDFRDNYVNGSAPDDFASIGLKFDDCVRIISTTYNSYYYDGTRTTDQTMYLKDGGLGSKAPITGLRDKVSGFKLNVDHGHMTTTLNRFLCGSNYKGTIGGQFIYEHNQGGGNVTSVSASFGALSVSYSGGPEALQRGTDPTYVTYGS